MRENDGRKLGRKTLEELRIRTVRRILEEEVRPDEAAETLGLARSTVYGWLTAYRTGGWDALKERKAPGAVPKLSVEQQRALFKLVAGRDPRQLEFDFALWTRERVRELIRREFGVKMHVTAVGRLLRRLGLTPQRPLWRAWQQDPARVERWKREEFPALKAEAKKAGASIWFADEAGIRSDFHAGTTWAPAGQTPVVKTTGRRASVNMISAVTGKGALRFMVVEGGVNAGVFLTFVRRLVADTDRPVFLVMDNHSIHRSKQLRQFAEQSEGRLRLFYLPPYSPELNPDEWVWKNVKHDRIATAGLDDHNDLKGKALSALHRLQKLPDVVQGFFHAPDLTYINS
ncbi:IS630 family transposase [Streptomyces noursei]|uniref:Transposase n=1 Tax=Streptomyces noursei TaxID=1971 RepID=A0A2N8PFX4_STRNR|nr:IS630 family transposase [Streptomyces noursei]PNE39920.1 transposase [Streptomyces noursei]